MPDAKVQIFISHISEEQVEALRAKNYLETVFPDLVDVFIASSWTSIAPGEEWFTKIENAIRKADIMLVFASGDSVGRAWLQFETGAGWFAKQTKVVPLCHKGMTPAALPDPIRRLQAVDINAPNEAERLAKLAAAVRMIADLPEPAAMAIDALGAPPVAAAAAAVKGWVVRPAAHVNEEAEGVFRVGDIRAVDIQRAKLAGLNPADSIYVRLFVEPPTGQYVNAMAEGAVAALFETLETGAAVRAKIKLCAVFAGQEAEDRASPVIAVIQAQARPEG